MHTPEETEPLKLFEKKDHTYSDEMTNNVCYHEFQKLCHRHRQRKILSLDSDLPAEVPYLFYQVRKYFQSF